MNNKYVIVRGSAGMNVTPVPDVIKDYCKELQKVMPSLEVYIPGEPSINRSSLHSSARVRDMLVRFKHEAGLLTAAVGAELQYLEVNWRPIDYLHEISEDGTQWDPPTYAGIVLAVVYTRPTPRVTLYMGIQFSEEAPT
ncbi:MAG: hypothetical protein HOP15_12350 [Planctomycetes bacterium]|nr:hypothetical protein [Planctomycetota bacterium]